ncbi:GDP-mannose 4,6-dehydratase [Marmoricola endophyticus]|uniref:GDP-mannose 4,6-dehydratase n=1 Tax=Marmoricola endophyticus TaxID=2040280 RepID=A0A917BRC6_9ACTN|nr:GDP-mannose 4,6-dehydratase [Marmoricola endophyticus]GGF51644.1 GDP-mannose 4,6-dehydratase [Marmoricola endophyticus]
MTPDSATALVTGVTGQDGSYLAERLLADGVAVHGLVHRASPDDTHVDGVVTHPGDLTDAEAMGRLLEEVEPDVVFNLGGISSVGQSWDQPGATARVSGLAPLDLMDACLRLQERSGREVRFVQASSAEIFGEADSSPQDEQTPVRPVNPYGVAKATAHLGANVFRQRGLHAVSCVLYNHESPRRPARFVTRKITQGAAMIAQGRLARLELGNLDARRDWGWAPDYVDAMVRAARHVEPMDFVVATGRAHTVRDFVAAAFARVGIEDWDRVVGVDESLVRPADPTEQRGDASRAAEVLGWTPTVDFAELVGRMVDADLDDPPTR